MDAPESQGHACDAAVVLAFSILGKRWNGMIVDTLKDGALSFVGLRRAVGGISDAMLSDRLSELTDARVLARRVEPGPPVAVTYELTSSGVELVPVLQQLGDWASANLTPTAKA